MKNIIFAILSFMFLIACKKNNGTDLPYTPSIPQNYSIDIDNDSLFDFEIVYLGLYAGVGGSHDISEFTFGAIKPIDNNQFLIGHESNCLFLFENDTIKKYDNNTAKWNEPYDYGSLIDISKRNGIWDKEWHIISDLPFDHFVGIKLERNDTEKIGWVLLDMNTHTGEITIVKSEITSDNELIINK